MDNQEEIILNLSLDKISDSYSKFRQNRTETGSKLEQSMMTFGQLSPIVVYQTDREKFEIIDGLKRWRIAKKIDSFTSLKARVLNLGPHASKAAIIKLNWAHKSISPYEEATILFSLFHDDGLSQVEIAKLFGRDKSWVSRRISLVAELIDEIKEQIKLGLVTISAGKELARLSRNNQLSTFKTVQKHHLSAREVRRLVSQLLSSPSWEHANILYLPLDILDSRNPPRPTKQSADQNILKLNKQLLDLERSGKMVMDSLGLLGPIGGPLMEHLEIRGNMDSTVKQMKLVIDKLLSLQQQILQESQKIPF